MSDKLKSNSIKIAIVGMTGSGKTVLITTLAMKMAQMALEDVYLAPFGDNRRETLRYTQSNWQTLNSGQWPPSTPAGELIELQWELSTQNAQATVQFLDCAGQDIRSLFSSDEIIPTSLEGDLKRVFDSVNSANVLIFLVNMKDLLATSDATSEILDLDQMLHVLQQRNDIPRRIAVAFSQYDKYKPEVDQRFNGDFLEYVRHNLPYLYGQYKRFHSFELIPVAAVNDTQSVVENGEVRQYPVPFFSSYNLETLIHWIADSVEELAALKNQPYRFLTSSRKSAGARKARTGKNNSLFSWKTLFTVLILVGVAVAGIWYCSSEAEKANEASRQEEAVQLYREAIALKNEKRYEEALSKMNEARELSPYDDDYYQEKQFIEGLIADQANAYRFYSQAVDLRVGKRYNEALINIDKALSLSPDNKQYLTEKQTIEDLIAESKRQKQANSLYQQAVSLQKQKKYDEALAKINEALKLYPDDKDYQNTKQQIDDLIAQNKRQEQANSLYNQAISLQNQKKYDEALAKTNEALDLHPQDTKLLDLKNSLDAKINEIHRQEIADDLYKKAVDFRNKQKYVEALAEIEEALKLAPQDVKLQNEKKSLNSTIAENKRKEQAESLYKEALSLRNKKEYDKAMSKINEALELFPKNSHMLDVKKNLESLISETKRQEFAEDRYNMAVDYRKKGDLEGAVENINGALLIFPNNKTYKAEKEAIQKSIDARNQLFAKPGSKAGERRVFYLHGVAFAFRWCPPGTFKMGDASYHNVTLTKGFWMLETEVTQKQWNAIMSSNPSKFDKGDDYPVNSVSWYDCQTFCWKCCRLGLPVQLPTEAQWEYACRAGSSTAYFWGDALNGDKANCKGEIPSGTTVRGKSLGRPTTVKSYSFNPWGLYDMHGNISEWCQDWYGIFSGNDVTDPTGPSDGKERVVRGGSFYDEAKMCSSGFRYAARQPDANSAVYGFRCIVKDGAKLSEIESEVMKNLPKNRPVLTQPAKEVPSDIDDDIVAADDYAPEDDDAEPFGAADNDYNPEDEDAEPVADDDYDPEDEDAEPFGAADDEVDSFFEPADTVDN